MTLTKADRERLRARAIRIDINGFQTISVGIIIELLPLLDALDEAERQELEATEDAAQLARQLAVLSAEADRYRALVRELAKRPCESVSVLCVGSMRAPVPGDCGACLNCRARALVAHDATNRHDDV
jgi:hypothetical protein